MNEKQQRLVSLRGTLDFSVAILRRELKDNSNDRISFEQELEYLKDSLEIQKVYESEVSFMIFIDPCFRVMRGFLLVSMYGYYGMLIYEYLFFFASLITPSSNFSC